MSDYVPGGDAEFSAWLDNFVTYATPTSPAWGWSPPTDPADLTFVALDTKTPIRSTSTGSMAARTPITCCAG